VNTLLLLQRTISQSIDTTRCQLFLNIGPDYFFRENLATLDLLNKEKMECDTNVHNRHNRDNTWYGNQMVNHIAQTDCLILPKHLDVSIKN
jgi:hypothetical protein